MHATISAALIAAAVATAPLAQADADQTFLSQVAGIPLSPTDAITYAHRTCDAQALPSFSIGIPPPRTLAFLQGQRELQARGLTEPQMFTLKKAAIIAYCPELRDF
jgi:hypothetical protein